MKSCVSFAWPWGMLSEMVLCPWICCICRWTAKSCKIHVLCVLSLVLALLSVYRCCWPSTMTSITLSRSFAKRAFWRGMRWNLLCWEVCWSLLVLRASTVGVWGASLNFSKHSPSTAQPVRCSSTNLHKHVLVCACIQTVTLCRGLSPNSHSVLCAAVKTYHGWAKCPSEERQASLPRGELSSHSPAIWQHVPVGLVFVLLIEFTFTLWTLRSCEALWGITSHLVKMWPPHTVKMSQGVSQQQALPFVLFQYPARPCFQSPLCVIFYFNKHSLVSSAGLAFLLPDCR